MKKNNHIIRRHAIEVKLASEKNAADLHEQVKNIYLEKIIPKLDDLFSELATDEVVLRIDHLQLDLGVLEMDKLEEQFAAKIMETVRDSLERKLQFDIAESDMELVQTQRSFIDTFLYFLELGQLPWWSSIKDLAILEKEISQQTSSHSILKNKLTVLIADQPLSAERLVFQFSDQFLQLIAAIYFPSFKAGNILDELTTLFTSVTNGNNRYLRDLFWKNVCKNLDQPPESIYTVTVNEVINLSGKKYNLSRAEILSSIRQSDAVAFPHLQPFFIASAGDNHEKNTLRKSKTDDKIPGKHSKHAKPIKNTETDKIERPGATDKKDESAGDIQDDENNSINATGIDTDKREIKSKHEETIENSYKAQTGVNPKKTSANKSDQKKDGLKKQPEGTIIYPEFAGLVILHPFLSPFFAGLGLTDGKRFLHEEALHKAIALLGYLATGEKEVQEQRLVIPKLICGMGPLKPVRKNILITVEEQNEADKLLTAVIGHWTALKNTSINGLRDTFLQREGKLSHTDSGWQLEVEHKTWDILLGKLPWGISMIKFSWMKELLFVNWGSG